MTRYGSEAAFVTKICKGDPSGRRGGMAGVVENGRLVTIRWLCYLSRKRADLVGFFFIFFFSHQSSIRAATIQV